MNKPVNPYILNHQNDFRNGYWICPVCGECYTARKEAQKCFRWHYEVDKITEKDK